LTGLHENFEPALKLFEKLLTGLKADKQVWDELVQKTLKVRADNKLSKDVILRAAMVSYAKYGPQNPFTNILSEAQLKALDPAELTKFAHTAKNFKHRVLYYGPSGKENLNSLI